MATEPEVLITLLLKKAETSFQSQTGLQSSLHVHDLDRHRATSLSAEYPRWRAITESGNNVAISLYIVVVPNAKRAYA